MTSINIYKGIKNPMKAVKAVFNMLLNRYALLIKNDELYLRLRWWANMDYPLNLDNPITFNEKIQWLKLHNHKPEYTTMVDKVEAKKYVANIIGEEYIIPTLAVYNSAEEIDFEKLPDRFVLKCTHDSADIVICRDKSKLNYDEARRKMARGLKRNYYWKSREWPYKDVKPRIIAEQFIKPESDVKDLHDYKFFCFGGVAKCFKIDFNRQTDHHANYYDRNGILLPFGEKSYAPQPEKKLEIPDKLSKMIEIAELLAKGIEFVRVDLYNLKGKILFGEITFFPASGMGKLEPEEWDERLGELMDLTRV